MDDIIIFLLLTLTMLVGCYLAGSLPLALSLSEEKLRYVTVFKAGLLIGTALTVIIPEGVNAIISTPEHHSNPILEKAAAEKAKFGKVLNLRAALAIDQHGNGGMLKAVTHRGLEAHSLIGIALVLGFVFMLLVDQIGGRAHVSHSSVADSGSGSNARNRFTATLGLIVHAAADGIAFGAAASTSRTHIEIIVFIAIMLHKAPAAFGLVTFLLHEGFERSRIRKHLAVFSLAAPVLALITYFGLSRGNKEYILDINATGFAMLFSGGTFLYVATVHILPEITNKRSSSSSSSLIMDDPENLSMDHIHKGFSKKELILLVTGCVSPLILTISHSH